MFDPRMNLRDGVNHGKPQTLLHKIELSLVALSRKWNNKKAKRVSLVGPGPLTGYLGALGIVLFTLEACPLGSLFRSADH